MRRIVPCNLRVKEGKNTIKGGRGGAEFFRSPFGERKNPAAARKRCRRPGFQPGSAPPPPPLILFFMPQGPPAPVGRRGTLRLCPARKAGGAEPEPKKAEQGRSVRLALPAVGRAFRSARRPSAADAAALFRLFGLNPPVIS